MVRSRFHGFVVGPDGTEVNFPRCNGERPDRAVFVMMGLTDGSGKSADANPVAPHDRVLCFAVFVQIGHVHGFRIFGSELEDISYLNPREIVMDGFPQCGQTPPSGILAKS